MLQWHENEKKKYIYIYSRYVAFVWIWICNVIVNMHVSPNPRSPRERHSGLQKRLPIEQQSHLLLTLLQSYVKDNAGIELPLAR